MKFVLDENIPVELGPWLKAGGHQIYSAAKGSCDEDVANLAKTCGAIILTQDRHFSNSLRFPPKDFSGIIRIKIHPSYIDDIMRSMDKLLGIFQSAENFNGRLIILGKEGFFKIRE